MSETDGDTIEDDKTSTPEQTFQKKDERNEVQRLIQDLPEKNRVPLLLYYSAQMKVEEIAQVLKLPEGTVKSRLRKAKQIMKEKLEALGYE
jgi:RNA polymerase sigma-70 factor (ECF subfamily)